MAESQLAANLGGENWGDTKRLIIFSPWYLMTLLANPHQVRSFLRFHLARKVFEITITSLTFQLKIFTYTLHATSRWEKG